MNANQRRQTSHPAAPPSAQSTAKYTNKDGSKFITIPKASNSTESSETSPVMAQTTINASAQAPNPAPANNGNSGTVNRKKQKRRQKQAEQAARIAGQMSEPPISNGLSNASQVNGRGHATSPQSSYDDGYEGENVQYHTGEGDRVYYSDDDGGVYPGSPRNVYANSPVSLTPAKKKGKGKGVQYDPHDQSHRSASNYGIRNMPLPPPPPPPQAVQPGMSKEKIWNTSSQEERERIKMFWLSLGEEERRSLVKVEKDAVLKKMKEQQKHSCSCTVCGRKRVAIEEELEVLYDAYYEELEQYANNQQGDGPPPLMAASRRFGPMSGLQPPNRLPPTFNSRQPSRGKIVEHFGDDEDEEGDEEYSEDDPDGEDYLSDDEPVEEIPRSHATDFFNFGQSLTVQGGILTVADDLLKNDGKKFIEMMEQLAERRMAREEDAKEQHYANPNGYPHAPNGNMQPHHSHHNHPPPPDDEEYDDEEDEEEDYDSQDEDYDEEEMDTMTEEQRMEEGRRMFQIFAARMFEQRVLTAYKEKVAAERQEKLLQELEEEDMADVQKKAKKAREAQKKKEKAQQKKLALTEAKAKRDAEKADAEAALRAEEEKKAEEARLRAEEKRRKREAQKKAEEEERLRKEADKQRRLLEQRERQAELERKQRDAKEREKREKEELRQKEREAKEAKEREVRERKEKLDREKKDSDLKAKAEREAQDQMKRETQSTAVPNAAVPQPLKRAQQHISIPTPAGLHSGHSNVLPHVPVAIPAIPKAPTPNRPAALVQRDASGSLPQTPLAGSVQSQSTSPNPPTSQQSSPLPSGHLGKPSSQPPFLHQPQATSPIHSALKGPPLSFQPSPFPGMQPMGMNAYQPGMPMMVPGFGGRMHHDPMFGHQQNQFRPLPGPNGMHMHPGMNGMPIPQSRGFPSQHAPPGFPQQLPNGTIPGQIFGGSKDSVAPHSHSRQQSASFEKPVFDIPAGAALTQPIARPAPIGRPSSVVQGQRQHEGHYTGKSDIDDLSNHLGSSALLDDSDEPLTSVPNARRASVVPGLRQGFPSVPYGMDPSAFQNPISSYNTWGAPPSNPFGTSSLPGSNYLGGWGNSPGNSFGGVGGPGVRPSQPRSVAVRLMICRACRNLEGSSPDGFHSIKAVREQIERINPLRDEPISEREILDLCETEGNPNNGGGFFDLRTDGHDHHFIRYEADLPSIHRPVGAPGDIGSPVVGGGGMSRYPPGQPGILTPSGF